ncbi:SGNH/GDSL hydrolase family protein [Candidatus Sumerlaeota bacterium]|nr:SGNH/GDSL hydrolase family protein [Candidatus Sumerlaeota bacterium]
MTESDPQPRPRRKLGWFKKLIFSLILLGLMAGAIAAFISAAERRAAAVIAKNPDFVKARTILMGAGKGEERYSADPEQKVIGKPYLLYIPAPGYTAKGHNDHGYRGPVVPVKRTTDVARVLFIGGSTVYGWTVDKAEETYPLQIKKILDGQLPPNIKGLEVINAGLPFGSSAEHLTHYHFKYRYYHPDLVVLECGGNDAGVDQIKFYQPDYSHWRQEIMPIKPLPPQYRWIMKSEIGSLFMINCIQPEFVTRQAFIRPSMQEPPLAAWFGDRETEVRQQYGIPDEYNAFYHNIQALVREIRDDGVKLMVVPFLPNRNNIRGYGYADFSLVCMERNKDILKKLAAEVQATFVNVENENLPKEGWGDPYCHLNPIGEEAKAKYLAPFVKQMLEGITPKSEPPLYPPADAYPGATPP